MTVMLIKEKGTLFLNHQLVFVQVYWLVLSADSDWPAKELTVFP